MKLLLTFRIGKHDRVDLIQGFYNILIFKVRKILISLFWKLNRCSTSVTVKSKPWLISKFLLMALLGFLSNKMHNHGGCLVLAATSNAILWFCFSSCLMVSSKFLLSLGLSLRHFSSRGFNLQAFSIPRPKVSTR